MAVETRVPNARLIQLREDAGLSQQDLADELNDLAAARHGKHPLVTRKTVGRWERGDVVWPQPFYRRLLAEWFLYSVGELGFHRPRRTRSEEPATDAPVDLISTPAPADPYVERDQQQWRDVRAALGRHRHDLAVLAESLYRENRVAGLVGTGVISTPSWLPAEPVPLDDIQLELEPDVPEPTITGGEPESAACSSGSSDVPCQTTCRAWTRIRPGPSMRRGGSCKPVSTIPRSPTSSTTVSSARPPSQRVSMGS